MSRNNRECLGLTERFLDLIEGLPDLDSFRATQILLLAVPAIIGCASGADAIDSSIIVRSSAVKNRLTRFSHRLVGTTIAFVIPLYVNHVCLSSDSLAQSRRAHEASLHKLPRATSEGQRNHSLHLIAPGEG